MAERGKGEREAWCKEQTENLYHYIFRRCNATVLFVCGKSLFRKRPRLLLYRPFQTLFESPGEKLIHQSYKSVMSPMSSLKSYLRGNHALCEKSRVEFESVINLKLTPLTK